MAQSKKETIVFTQGLDLKTDEMMLEPGALLECENVTFNTPGALKKRNGFKKLQSDVIDSPTAFVSSSTGLFTFGQELLISTDTDLLTYLSSRGQWKNIGQLPPVYSNVKGISTSRTDQRNPVSAINGRIIWYAWEDQGFIYVSAKDGSTNSFIINDKLLIQGHNVRLITFNEQIIATWVDTISGYIYIATLTLEALLNDQYFQRDLITSNYNEVYDVVVLDDKLYIAYSTTTAETQIAQYDIEFAVASIDASFDSDNFIDLTTYNDEIVVTAINSSSNINLFSVNDNLATGSYNTLTSSIPFSGSYTAINKVSFLSNKLFLEIDDAIYTSTPTGSTFTSASLVQNNAFMVSKAFEFNDLMCVSTVNSSSNNYSFRQHVVTSNGKAIAKMNIDTAGIRTSTVLPVPINNSSVFQFPGERTELFETTNEDGTPEIGTYAIVDNEINLGDLSSIRYNDSLHFPGSIMRTYDGGTVVETNFLQYPEIISATEVTSAGTDLSAGTYLYAFTYAWTDKQGQTHESSPSTYKSVTVGSNGSLMLFEVTPLTLTDKENVRIIGYRSAERLGLTTFNTPLYRFTSISNPTANDKSLKTIVIGDDNSDAQITTNRTVHSTTEVLNDAPPPCSSAVVKDNRVWVISSDNQNQIHYSKTSVEGEPLRFASSVAEFFVDVQDDDNENITALAVLNEKLLIFKPKKIYSLINQGPDNTGANNSLSDPELVTSDNGCQLQNSIVVINNDEGVSGIIYKSNRGIQFIGSGGGIIEYIGAPVEPYNDLNIVQSVLVPSQDQVRFLTDSNVALVFDYKRRLWATWTNHQTVGATIVDDVFYRSKADGSVYGDAGTYSDDGVPIKMKVTTGWISPVGHNEFGRLKRVWLLGDRKGSHNFKVRVGFNYDPNYDAKFIELYDIDDILNSNDFEELGLEGFQNEYQRMSLGMRMSQKMTSFRVSFEDVQTTTTTEGYSISTLSYEFSTKKGFNRITPKARGKD